MALQNPFDTLGINEHASSAEIHRAYRSLARKWHPDRFPEGPERAWAEQKMIEINRAYSECCTRVCPPVDNEPSGRYTEIRFLIDAGQLSRARQLLLAMGERDAEWNFTFGHMLSERGDYEKAIVYYGIACRLSPESELYKAALSAARAQKSAGGNHLFARALSALKALKHKISAVW